MRQKNESVFCAVEWVDFFTSLFFLAKALEAVSVVVQVIPKMLVQGTKVQSSQGDINLQLTAVRLKTVFILQI